jgi:hypothetical protein
MIELQSKVALSGRELNEFQVLKRQWQRYIADLAKQQAQDHAGLISAGDQFNLKQSFNGTPGH